MSNTPLSGPEQIKIVFFIIISIISFPIGVLPSLILIIGYFLMKRNKNFSVLSASISGVYICSFIALALFILFAYLNYGWMQEEKYPSYGYQDNMQAFLYFAIVLFIYIFFLKTFFSSPLKKHKDWVGKNGMFTSQSQEEKEKSPEELNIIKGEKLKQYSVADELLKWAKLKEDGHVSDEDFNKIKSKLLNKEQN